jgi:hypothetical protein
MACEKCSAIDQLLKQQVRLLPCGQQQCTRRGQQHLCRVKLTAALITGITVATLPVFQGVLVASACCAFASHHIIHLPLGGANQYSRPQTRPSLATAGHAHMISCMCRGQVSRANLAI